MSDAWPSVSLGECLVKNEDWIRLDQTAEYREVTVRLWGRGVVLRGVTTGAEIAADTRVRVRTGQFILSRIDARNGASGIVPPELDGAVVSSDFPAFNVRRDRMLPEYLGWMAKTRAFVDRCIAASEGTTNRVRLKEDRFLAASIPLPPLAEQRRIVARLDALAAKIEEAKRLTNVVVHQCAALIRAAMDREFRSENDRASLESVCESVVDNLHTTPQYDGDEFACVRSQDVGWGTLNYGTALRTSSAEFTERTRRAEPRAGDIVFVREGDVGRCAVVDGSTRFSLGQRVMMLRPAAGRIAPEFLMLQLISPPVLDRQILSGKTGTTSHHVNIKHLRTVAVWCPPSEVQREVLTRVGSLRNRVGGLVAESQDRASKLDALLPSLLNRAFAGAL